MVATQRHAIFNLVVSLAALTTFAILIPHYGVARAQAGLAVLAFSGFGPIIFFSRRKFDERERAIFLRAAQITLIVLWLVLVGGIMAAYFVLSQQNSLMPVELLPLIVWLGGAALLICHAVAILTLHWWSNRGSAGSAE
jgi:nitrate reductase gamma subunit